MKLTNVVLKKDKAGWKTVGLPYQAHINHCGQLDSLKVGNFEYISKNAEPGKGLHIVDKEKAIEFSSIEIKEDSLSMIGVKANLNIQFLPTEIKVSIQNLKIDHGQCLRMNTNQKVSRIKSMNQAVEYKSPLEKNLYTEARLIGVNQSSITFGEAKSYHLNSGYLVSPRANDNLVKFPWVAKTSLSIFTILISSQPNIGDAIGVSFECDKKDFTFWDNKNKKLLTTISNPNPEKDVDAHLLLYIRSYLTKKVSKKIKRKLYLAAKQTKNITWEISNLDPMLYIAELWIKKGKQEELCSASRFVYDAENIVAPNEPEDFDTFWQRTLKEQKKVPIDLKIKKIKGEKEHDVYHFSFAGLLGYRCYGWLTVPKGRPKKHSAVLVLPPAGNRSQPIPIFKDKVAMSININTLDVNLKEYDVATWPAQYLVTGILDKEKYCLRFGYAAIVRAAEILAARPEVDKKHISVRGSSQGGGLAFIAAGLYPGFKSATCSKPGLCRLDWNLNYLNPAFFPIAFNHYTYASIETTLKYYLPSHFAKRIKCDVFVDFALYDDVTPCVGAFCAYNAILSKKSIEIDPHGTH